MYHIRYVDDLQWIIRFVQNLYHIHVTTKSVERIDYFDKFALFTEIFFHVMTTLYILSVFTFLPYPIYMYFFKNEVVPIIPLYLPYVDDEQLSGYIILGTFHIIIFFLATLGVLACDFFMAIVIISTFIFAKLITWDLEQTDTEQSAKDSLRLVRGRFRNVLLMHQEMIK